jgi:hypothetical protein
LDNLLSHFDLPGLERGRQGRERRISEVGLLAIEIVRLLSFELSVPMARATQLAATALRTRDGERSTVTTPSGVVVVLPIADIERGLRNRVVEAVETAAEIRRGRPASTR